MNKKEKFWALFGTCLLMVIVIATFSYHFMLGLLVIAGLVAVFAWSGKKASAHVEAPVEVVSNEEIEKELLSPQTIYEVCGVPTGTFKKFLEEKKDI